MVLSRTENHTIHGVFWISQLIISLNISTAVFLHGNENTVMHNSAAINSTGMKTKQ